MMPACSLKHQISYMAIFCKELIEACGVGFRTPRIVVHFSVGPDGGTVGDMIQLYKHSCLASDQSNYESNPLSRRYLL